MLRITKNLEPVAPACNKRNYGTLQRPGSTQREVQAGRTFTWRDRGDRASTPLMPLTCSLTSDIWTLQYIVRLFCSLQQQNGTMALLASRPAVVARPGVRRAQLAVATPLRTSHIARAKTESCDLPIGEPAPYFEVSSVLCKRCDNVRRVHGCLQTTMPNA